MHQEEISVPAHFVPEAALGDGITAPIRAGLAAIINSLDSHFMPAGFTLARLIETVGAVLGGLDTVNGAFGDQDSGATAADSLLSAANRLTQAPGRQANRALRVGEMQVTTQQLASIGADIARVLTVLQFYTVNLKIAAAGGDDFVEFANDMSVQLAAGTKEVENFRRQIAGMLVNLREMSALDAVLARECARVVPAVPDRLTTEVAKLRQRQAGLASVSTAARNIVTRIQAGVGKALGAIQIGDITRQRLEHVRDACQDFDETMIDLSAEDIAGAGGHMLRLFVEQVEDLNVDFAAQSRDLFDALNGLQPDCDDLLRYGAGNEMIADSGLFLRDLDDCITGAHGMTSQLHRADLKAADIAQAVLDVAQALRERVNVVERVRSDVDYMAINVNIRARQAKHIGRPVAVISEEIRVCAQQLAEMTSAINSAVESLSTASHGFSLECPGQNEPSVGEALAAALHIIREGARRADQAMAEVAVDARDIVEMIRNTAKDLEICRTLSDDLSTMAASLALSAGQGEAPEVADPRVVSMMEKMGRSYTMVSERVVHDRYLLPGMTPLVRAAPAASTSFDSFGEDDDDDGFGDVFL